MYFKSFPYKNNFYGSFYVVRKYKEQMMNVLLAQIQ